MVREMASRPQGVTVCEVAAFSGLEHSKAKSLVQNMRREEILCTYLPPGGMRSAIAYKLRTDAPAAKPVKVNIKAPKADTANSLMRKQILAMAARPTGVHSSELPEYTSTYFSGRCYELMNAGQLFRAQLGHRNTRYFTDKDAALRAELNANSDQSAKRPNVNTDASRGIAFHKDADVVYTDKTKFTRCPGFQARFEAVTSAFVHTALQSGRVAG